MSGTGNALLDRDGVGDWKGEGEGLGLGWGTVLEDPGDGIWIPPAYGFWCREFMEFWWRRPAMVLLEGVGGAELELFTLGMPLVDVICIADVSLFDVVWSCCWWCICCF